MNKPFAQSCEENKVVILQQLKNLLATANNCLEIGSGTGQHAVHFSEHLPHLSWQPSELKENIQGIKLWIEESVADNIQSPIELDVYDTLWMQDKLYDAAFTANTLHIMSIKHVEKLFSGLGRVLSKDALFICYGPFNYNGQFSSESNARFELWLKQQNPLSGLRDLDDLKRFAANHDIELIDDIEMPVNNRLLVWQKL